MIRPTKKRTTLSFPFIPARHAIHAVVVSVFESLSQLYNIASTLLHERHYGLLTLAVGEGPPTRRALSTNRLTGRRRAKAQSA
jgi:hypothetical protein